MKSIRTVLGVALTAALLFATATFHADAQTSTTGTTATVGSTSPAPTDAQLPPTPQTIWDFVTTGSNYWVAPFMTYSTKSHDIGGGIALGYHVSDVVNPVVRLDDFAHQLYCVSGNLQLQVPRKLMGSIPVIPFALAGVATSFSGNGADNGSVSGIIGIGAAMDWTVFGNSWLCRHAFSAVDYERWSGLPSAQQNQVRIAILSLKLGGS